MKLTSDPDVLSARGGDRDAFGRLVTRYRGLVSAISLSTVGNVAASEDVAQEVFLCAWRDLGSLQSPSSFVPWLRQLTRHRALDALRGGRRRGLADEPALEHVVDSSPNASEALLEGERARVVALGLAALPSDAREVITLYYREDQSIAQVASLLGLREGAAKKRLSRARAALRSELLTRFADAVETSAPGEAFTNQVLLGLSPATPVAGVAAGKGLLLVVAKAAPLALAWAWLAGIVGGMASVLWGLRRDLRRAIDARERKQLWLIAAGVSLGIVCFELAITTLPPRSPTTGSQRLWLGTAYTLAYSAAIFAAYFLGHRRLEARRRTAELLVDPSAAARHARKDQLGRRGAALASAIVLSVLVAAWLRG
jgi:RNA polymerase sigma factor (sigma-70 family)